MARIVFAVISLVALVASAHARELHQSYPDNAACQQIVDNAGGQDAIKQLVVSGCQNNGQFDEAACCDTVKGVASAAQGCECNPDVWRQVQDNIGGANIAGLDTAAVPGFISNCASQGLKVYGYGC